jgi:uracil-DNA glycosylase
MVPNELPTKLADYRIAIIGEAPGQDEEDYGRPFVGVSGKFLTNIMREVGIDRQCCLIGNVCQVRPPRNEIALFKWEGEEIQDGLIRLKADIDSYNPSVCVLLGNTPLHAALGPKRKISNWRGSLFISDIPGPFMGRKCIASLHPAYVLREFSGYPLLKFDLKRAVGEAFSPNLVIPSRTLITDLDADATCQILDNWASGQRCSIDIEGTLNNWICVGLASKPTEAICIVWNKFPPTECSRVLRSFAALMFRTDVPKILQNQLYDNFVLSYGYGIPIRNVAEDTLIKSWSIYAELPRSLATQASVWTRQPLWKDDTMYGQVGEGLYRGCAMDSAITLEICNAQDTVLRGKPLAHYHKMIELQNVFLYMELRGIRYNQPNIDQKLIEVSDRMKPVRSRLAESAGIDLCGTKGSLSATKLIKCLYTDKSYPPQYRKDSEGGERRLTSDIEAILTLKRQFPNDTFLSDVLLHRHLEGVRETLQITADADGRVRCGYSLEAETGRVKCYKSPTGSGANLQTIQKSLRGNYVADTGHELFQIDLEGADGWTVACECARLGDTTMLDDYLAGMKPAKIIALLYWFGVEINQLDRTDLKWLHDNMFPIVKKLAGDWIYLGSKRVQHGSSYMMGIPTMVLNILKDSFKESGTPIYLEHSIAKTLQNAMFSRYPGIQSWHAWAQTKLVADGQLDAASGQNRLFFGRRFGPSIHETVKEFLAHRPQANTTWATNLAALNLWNDPENRRLDNSLIIEPLHQIHDALLVQSPVELHDWTILKIKGYFNNELEIAGRRIKIPFEMSYGPDWGSLKTI